MDFELPTIEVGAHTYQIGKLDAFAQLHVARKLAPLLAGVQKLSDITLDTAAPAILKSLSEMPDADVEYVIAKCLSVVRRKLPAGVAGWTPIWNAAAKRPQFEDLELGEIMQLTAQVVTRSLSGFLGGLGPAIASQQAASPAS